MCICAQEPKTAQAAHHTAQAAHHCSCCSSPLLRLPITAHAAHHHCSGCPSLHIDWKGYILQQLAAHVQQLVLIKYACRVCLTCPGDSVHQLHAEHWRLGEVTCIQGTFGLLANLLDPGIVDVQLLFPPFIVDTQARKILARPAPNLHLVACDVHDHCPEIVQGIFDVFL